MSFWYLYNKSYYRVAIVTLEKTGNSGNSEWIITAFLALLHRKGSKRN